MIYELNKSQFKNISPLLVGNRCNIEIKAVVELNNPGWIFVDNIREPKTALVWSKGIQGFYFVGDEGNPELNDYINDYIDIIIRPRARKLGFNWFECSGISSKWEESIESIFQKRKLHKYYQYVYRFKDFQLDFSDIRPLNDRYDVRRVDRELIEGDYDNKDFLLSEIQLFWSSVEDFLQRGVGFCIVDDKMIISRCISSFVSEDIHAIGIETLKEYRKKGLAKRSVAELLKSLKDKNLEPYWDCMKTNVASASLAESVGFSKAFEYALYEFSFED